MKTGRREWDEKLAAVDLFDPDEPVFLIRARDVCGASAVRDYAERLRLYGADHTLIDAVIKHAALMDLWPEKQVPTVPLTPGQMAQQAYEAQRARHREVNGTPERKVRAPRR